MKVSTLLGVGMGDPVVVPSTRRPPSTSWPATIASPGSRLQRARAPAPARTTPMRSSGIATSPKSSVRTRHESTVVQDARSAMPAMRSWWGSVLHEALIDAAPAGDAVARLCIRPSSCQAVSRRSRGPRLIERHPVEVRWADAAGPGWTGRCGAQASTSSAIARLDEAWCCRRRRNGRSGSPSPPKTPMVRPPCPGSASHWVSGAGEWSSCTTASASRSGMVLASALWECHSVSRLSPDAVTRRTV